MQLSLRSGGSKQTKEYAQKIGQHLKGGEVFELSSDLGGGKTTFVKGLVEGFGSKDPVSSPTFTINYTYGRNDGARFHHFDFYRLSDPGIIANELAEVVDDEHDVVAVEWAQIVEGVLVRPHINVVLKNTGDDTRKILIDLPTQYEYLAKDIK